MKFHSLTNTNPVLQEKMRFFADYFSFANEFIGRIPELPFENASSLLSKILSQLTNNQNHCVAYIENYFTQLVSFYDYSFVDKTQAFNTIKKHFEEMKCFSIPDCQTPKLKWIKDYPEFITDLELLLKECESDFDNALKCGYSLIACNCALKEHLDQLKYCAHIVVSEFRLKGHSQEAVGKYINRLLNKDVPKPPEIISIVDKFEKKLKVDEYYQNDSFKEQFYGLRNILHASTHQSGYFIYVVKNAYIDEITKNEFIITLDKVTFVSTSHKHVGNIKKTFIKRYTKDDVLLAPNFFDSNYLLAYLKLNYEKVETTSQTGLELVKQELNQLNQYLNTNLSVDDSDYMFSKNISKSVDSIRYGITPTNKSRIQHIFFQDAKENAFEKLRNVKSKSKNVILQNERTFLKAFAGNEISSFWIYTENLFWNTKFSEPRDQQKRVKNILIKYIEKHKVLLMLSVMMALRHSELTPEQTGLTIEETTKMCNNVLFDHNYKHDFSIYKSKVKSGFLKDFFKYLKGFDSAPQKEKWKEFYASILLELYEYRNMELHSGKTNIASRYKLASIIPSLLNTIRWALIHGSAQHPELNFEELILELSKPT